MYDHHKRVIARLTEQIQADPQYLALIIGGSLVKGWGRPDSDIDILLLVSEKNYQQRYNEGRLLYFDQSICDYEGGYIDGKHIDLKYLQEAAERGIEPTRSAFAKAIIAFTRVPELDSWIQKIATYPEHEREIKMKKFYSQILLLRWFIGEAQKRDDTYLMTRSVADLVLFGGRLILAYNRMLYPFHKWFMRVLTDAPEKPENFMELTHALLQKPDKEIAEAYVDSINQFHDWGVEFSEAVTHFSHDREWHWRVGPPPIHDW